MPAKIPKPTIFSMPKTQLKGSLGEKRGKNKSSANFPASKDSKNDHKIPKDLRVGVKKEAKITQRTPSLDQNESNRVQKYLKDYLLASQKTGCSKSTIRNYKSDINQFLRFLESNDLEDLKSKPKLLAFAQYQRDKGLKENSIKRKLVSITQFKLWLKEQGLLSSEIPLSPELEKNLSDQELKTIEPKKFAQDEKVEAQANIKKLKDEKKAKLSEEIQKLRKEKKSRSGFVIAFNLLALLVFLSGLAFFAYQQFGQAVISMAYPSTPTKTSRILSYQGRLTDTAQNPINVNTNMSYKLYDADTAGTELWSSNTCAVDPDQDGIFNVNLGAGAGAGSDDESCGAEIDNDVFTENANVWLEVTVVAETLTPRQPIRTVAYAINAETLQGLPPAEVASHSTILMMDQNGEVVLGTTTPVLKSDSSSTSLTIESNQLILTTTTSSNGDITLSPDGTGNVLINSDLEIDGFLAAPGATLSSNYAGGIALVLKGGPSGTANIQEWQNSTGAVLSAVDSAGAADFADLTINSTYSFPTVDGSTDQILSTDGSGALSWVAAGGSSLWTDSGTDTYLTSLTDEVGIGTATPQSKFEIYNAGSATNAPADAHLLLQSSANAAYRWGQRIDTSGNLNFDSNWGATDVTRLTLERGGDIGIGDITPDHKLDVAGNIGLDASSYINWGDTDGTTGYGFYDNGGTLQYKNSGGSWADISSGGGSSLWTDSGADIYLTSLTDDVGIGIATPDARLEVRLNSANDDLRLKLGKTFENDPYHLALDAGMSNRGFAFTSEEGVYQQTMLFSDTDSDDDVFFGLSTSDDGGSTWNPAFTINQNGNIGIGTATASAKLSIAGSSSSISNDDGDINIDAASDMVNFNSDSLVNFTQASGSSGTTSQPTYSFNSDPNSGMFSPQADNLAWTVGGSEAMRIIADGSVGISTTTPDEKLTVDGGINAEKYYDITNKTYFLDPAAVSTSLKTAGDADIGGDVYVGGGELFFTPLSSSTSTTEGTVYYDNDVDHLYLYDGASTWNRIAMDMTKYSDTDTLANEAYIEIAHNQNSNDISFTAWIQDTISGLWEEAEIVSPTIGHYLSNVWNDADSDGIIRTDVRQTNIELSPGINIGSGADGDITISSDTNINTADSISSRSCADGGDAVNYSVTALTSTTATLSSSPSTNCLVAGDEILLINLQGTSTAFDNVGNYETLKILSLSTDTITFESSKTKYYGDNSTDDTNLGIIAGTQRVMLQRVPNYNDVTVSSSYNFYPSDWDGVTGGVMFFRSNGAVSISGTIHADGKGYRGGDGGAAGTYAAGDGGESISGLGGQGSTTRTGNGSNGAAGGGGGEAGVGGDGYSGGGGGLVGGGTAGSGSSTVGGSGGGGGVKSGGGGGGGYGSAGVGAGTNSSETPSGDDGGSGGTYGEATLSNIYLGSGGGGGGNYSNNSGYGGTGGDGGGVVKIHSSSITISGTMSSDGEDGTNGSCTGVVMYDGGGGGAAGGSIMIESGTSTIGTGLVSVENGTGGDGCNVTTVTNYGIDAGDGRIAIYYLDGHSGTTSNASVTNSYDAEYNSYGLYHSPAIATPNAISYDNIRWLEDLDTYGNISIQTRSGSDDDPSDGGWESWKPFTVTTNYLSLNDADTHTDWTGTNVTVAEGDVARDVELFEDEDESTVGNTTKLTSSTNGGYAEATISSTDISGYDYLTAWVRASEIGNTIKLSIGETAGNEEEEGITIDTTGIWQKIYWDISDITNTDMDGITKLRLTNLTTNSNTIYLDNVRVETLSTDNNGSQIGSTPNDYLQYRVIFSTTNVAYQPKLENIVFDYNNGYEVEQVDANTVRLYNYTGESQDMRLDIIVFGADLAEWYTIDDESIGPGDLVSITGEMDQYGVPILSKSTQDNDPLLIGAISTKAGQELGLPADNRRLLGLDGRIPVKIDPNSETISKGDHLTSSPIPGMARKAKAGELSIGRAFSNWTPDSDQEKLMIIINDVMATPSFGQDLVDGITELADLLNLKIKDNWQVVNENTGETVEAAAALAEAIIGKLKVGQMEVQEIAAPEGQDLAIEGSNITIQLDGSPDLTDPEASGSSPLGKLLIQDSDGEIVASFDSEGNAYISGALDVEGISKLGQLITEEATISTLLAENIKTNTLQTETASISGELIAENITADNAQFESLKVDSLEVDSIEANMIAGLEERLSSKIAESLSEPSLLASLFGDELEQNDQYLEELNAEINDNLDFEEDLTLSDLEGDDGDLTLMADTAFINNYFEVNGNSYISDSLKIGSNLIFESGLAIANNYIAYQPELEILTDENGNQIENNDFTFSIQPTGRGKLSLMAGLMELDHSGMIAINGDLKVAGAVEIADDLKVEGSLLSNLIKSKNPGENIRVQLAQNIGAPEGENLNDSLFDQDGLIKGTDFEFVNENQTPVATFSASGDLYLEGSLRIGQDIAIATSSGELVSQKSAGQAILPVGQTEVVIRTSKLTENSMIYITPLNSTNNQVLYIKGKLLDSSFTPENEAQFTVGFDTALAQDVAFNWWIIN